MLDIYLALLLVLVGVLSFMLGRYSTVSEGQGGVRICMVEESILTQSAAPRPGIQKVAVPVSSDKAASRQVQAASAAAAPVADLPTEGETGNYVASRTGKAYHLPWCPGAGRIKPENRVWFATKEAAEAAGYSPAGNCKGL